jgi:hypothetical protein
MVRRYSLSLNGPHRPDAPGPISGDVATIEEAQRMLLASWRRWQEWAGMRDIEWSLSELGIVDQQPSR